MTKTISAAQLILVGVMALTPSAVLAEGFTYSLVLQAKLTNGRLIDLPGLPMTDLLDCNYAKQKTQIGRKFQPGLIVTPDGKSPAGTIVGARCVARVQGN